MKQTLNQCVVGKSHYWGFYYHFHFSIIWIFYLIWHSLWKRRNRITLFIADFVVSKYMYITSTDTRRIYFSSIYKYFFYLWEKHNVRCLWLFRYVNCLHTYTCCRMTIQRNSHPKGKHLGWSMTENQSQTHSSAWNISRKREE